MLGFVVEDSSASCERCSKCRMFFPPAILYHNLLHERPSLPRFPVGLRWVELGWTERVTTTSELGWQEPPSLISI